MSNDGHSGTSIRDIPQWNEMVVLHIVYVAGSGIEIANLVRYDRVM